MKFKIGITGTGSLVGQGIIKSIIRSEYANSYTLIGFDYFKDTVGSFWCEKNFILPDILNPNISTEDWLKVLTEIIRKESLQVLFIGVDFELPILAIERERIKEETGCIIMVSDDKVVEIGNDKYLTYKFLKENNLNYPETYLPHEVDFKDLKYPIIIKPRIGARSVGVYKIKSQSELEEKLKLVDGPIIQELVGDDDTEYTCGILVLDGQLKGDIVLRRSLKAGNTHTSEYKEDFSGKITDYIKEIAEKLQPFGSCNLQLRVNELGVPKLFEINPRHSGTTYMRTLFGYNEVIFILKSILENIEVPFDLKEGKALRFYDEKLV